MKDLECGLRRWLRHDPERGTILKESPGVLLLLLLLILLLLSRSAVPRSGLGPILGSGSGCLLPQVARRKLESGVGWG